MSAGQRLVNSWPFRLRQSSSTELRSGGTREGVRSVSTGTQISQAVEIESSPPLRSLRGLGGADEAGLELALEAIGIAAGMFKVLWRMRSRIAGAMIRSPKAPPAAEALLTAGISGEAEQAHSRCTAGSVLPSHLRQSGTQQRE